MFQLILNKDKVSLNLGIQLLKNFTEEDYFCNIEDSVEIMCNLDIILCYGKVDYLEYLLNQRIELFSKEKIEKYCQFNPISSILFNSSLTLNEKKKFILQLPQQVHIVDKSGQNFLFYYVNYLMMSYSREFGKAEKTFFNWLKHKFKISSN